MIRIEFSLLSADFLFYFFKFPAVVVGLSVCWKVTLSPLVTCASKELVSPPAGSTTQWLDCAHRAAMQGPYPVWDWLDHVHFTPLPALLACLDAGFHGSCPVLKQCWTLHYSPSLRSLIAKSLNLNPLFLTIKRGFKGVRGLDQMFSVSKAQFCLIQ